MNTTIGHRHHQSPDNSQRKVATGGGGKKSTLNPTKNKRVRWIEIKGVTQAEEEPISPSAVNQGGDEESAMMNPSGSRTAGDEDQQQQQNSRQEGEDQNSGGGAGGGGGGKIPFYLDSEIIALGGVGGMTLELLGTANDSSAADDEPRATGEDTTMKARSRYMRSSVPVSSWVMSEPKNGGAEGGGEHQPAAPGATESTEQPRDPDNELHQKNEEGEEPLPIVDRALPLLSDRSGGDEEQLPPAALCIDHEGLCFLSTLHTNEPKQEQQPPKSGGDGNLEDSIDVYDGEEGFHVQFHKVTRVVPGAFSIGRSLPGSRQGLLAGGSRLSNRRPVSQQSFQTVSAGGSTTAAALGSSGKGGGPIRLCKPGVLGLGVAATSINQASFGGQDHRPGTAATSVYGGGLTSGASSLHGGSRPASRQQQQGAAPPYTSVNTSNLGITLTSLGSQVGGGVPPPMPLEDGASVFTTTIYGYGGWRYVAEDQDPEAVERDVEDERKEFQRLIYKAQLQIIMSLGPVEEKNEDEQITHEKQSNATSTSARPVVIRAEAVSVSTLPNKGLLLPPSTGFHTLDVLPKPPGSTSDSHNDRLILFGGFIDAQWKPKQFSSKDQYRLQKKREIYGDSYEEDLAARAEVTSQAPKKLKKKKKTASSVATSTLGGHEVPGGIVAVDDNFGDGRIIKPESLDPFHRGPASQTLAKKQSDDGSKTKTSEEVIRDEEREEDEALFCSNGTYSYESGTWTKLKCLGDVPSGRASHSSAISGDYLLVAGGLGEGGVSLLDIYALQVNRRLWVSLDFYPSPAVGARSFTLFSTSDAIWCASNGAPYVAVTPKDERNAAVLNNKLKYITTGLMNSASSGDPGETPPTVIRPQSVIDARLSSLGYERQIPMELQDKRRQRVEQIREEQKKRPPLRIMAKLEEEAANASERSSATDGQVTATSEELEARKKEKLKQVVDGVVGRLFTPGYIASKEKKREQIFFEKDRIRYEERLRFYGRTSDVVIEDDAFVRRFYEVPRDLEEMKHDKRQKELEKKGPQTVAISGVDEKVQELHANKNAKKKRETLLRKMGLNDLVDSQRDGRLPPVSADDSRSQNTKVTKPLSQEEKFSVGTRAQTVMARLNEKDEAHRKRQAVLFEKLVPSDEKGSFKPMTNTKAWAKKRSEILGKRPEIPK